MKQILVLSLLLILSTAVDAQVITARDLRVSEHMRPPLDTIIPPTRLHEVRFRAQDTSWYAAMNLTATKKWFKIGVSAAQTGDSGADTLVVAELGAGVPIFEVSPARDTLKLADFADGNLTHPVKNLDGSIRIDIVTLTGEGNLNFPGVAGRSSTFLNLGVAGVQPGDPVLIGTPAASSIPGVFFVGQVTQADIVTIICYNATTTAKDPNLGLFKVRVIHQ